ncbi:autotransporter outer membrane beta-barrel domain-containing protein [Silvimonas amylolytica]|uniref:Outer membrane autotransporter barrel domain-containing protein n=1 Tax=Silvimonas amylolytica TaxID=449663 RepID=A0ABQ2PP32_9NEIS|nr:autotransporter outer membrane beta-barrel domain-containing protein [Silvimonas amylolytica]GGP27048.1 outer membrane autotransporter barrel domain-containing protein [Silvimonas amylolytica]
MNRFFRTIWNASRNAWVAVAENASAHGKASKPSAVSEHLNLPRSVLAMGYGLVLALASADALAVATVELTEGDSKSIVGGYKDQSKAGGAAPDATQVVENYLFTGGTLDVTGGYYRATGKFTVAEGQYGKITGGSGTGLPSYFPTIPALDVAPTKSGAMFLLYDPREPGGQLVLEKNATLEIAFNYEGRNYVAITNNGNFDYNYTPVVFGENSHIMLTGGTFRYDPYRHDTDVKLSNFIFNGGWLSTRGGDDVITADENNQAIGKIEMGMGSDTFIIPEGVSITALRINGQPVSEVRMYEFADTQDKGTGGLTGNMTEGTGQNPSDTVQIRANASSTDIVYNFGYYNDFMTLADGAQLIGGKVSMGNGPDTFTATAATLDGVSIKLDDGDDTLNLTGTTLQGGVAIDLGNGNDTANLRDLSLNLTKTSSLLLGAGNDTANLTNVSLSGNTATDSITFGAGSDTLNLTRVNVDQASIGMTSGANVVNVLADISGGTTRVTNSLNFSSADKLSTLRIQDGATLAVDEASVGFAGKIQVNAGGKLAGTGVVTSTNGMALDGTLQVGDGTSDGALSVTDSARIDANDGALITGSGTLSSSGITLNGGVTAKVEADRALVYNDALAGTGSLQKVGAGTLALGAANSYSGGSNVDAGTLQLTQQNAAGTGAVALASNATVQLDFSGTDGQYDADFANNLNGSGNAVVSGHDINITGDNSAFDGQWQIGNAASMQVSADQQNLGTATIALDGTLNVAPESGGFTVNNSLTGQGTLIAKMGAGNDAFNFGTNTGSAFTGTLDMGRGTLALQGDNTKALTNATLLVDNGSVVTVGDGEQHIGGLAFHGGTTIFNATVPDATMAQSTINAAHLDASGTGAVGIVVPTPYTPSPVDAPNTVNLLQQDDGEIGVQLVTAATVNGYGGGLTLQDQNGNRVGGNQVLDIAQQDQIVAQGTYGYRLTTEPGDGLYVNYGLTQLDLQQNQTLTLAQNTGATGAAADMSAQIIGAGNLAINAGGSVISLSNATNRYEGETSVQSGTLRLEANNALGQTRQLNMADATTTDLNGTTQTIGALDGAAGSTLNFNGGALGISNGGTSQGVLTGAGELRALGGTLDVQGANMGLSVSTHIADGATVQLDHVQGLGSGKISDVGTLQLTGATGDLVNMLDGAGAVNLTGAADVNLVGNNRVFSGQFTTATGTQLTASSADNLGTASVNNSGTLKLSVNQDWALANAIEGTGTVVKNGAATLSVNTAQAWTGNTDVNAGTLFVGGAGQLASANVDVAPTARLGGYGTVQGTVNNQGAVLVGSAAQAGGPVGTFNIGGDLHNASTVTLAGANAQPGNTLKIAGNYIGQPGSTLIFNTALGDDQSATDHMEVAGNTSGGSNVEVKNANGAGALTHRGIELIRVDGQSDAEFSLQGRAVGGAYEYKLYKGSADAADGNWYLRSQKNPSADEDNTSPVEPGQLDHPVAVDHARFATPVYRPEPGAYLANQSAVKGWQMQTLRDRVGESYFDQNADAPRGAWARVTGDRVDSKAGQGELSQSGTRYLLQAGSELARWDRESGQRVHLGAMVSAGTASTDARADGNQARAKGEVNGVSVGLYSTWFGNAAEHKGPYVDTWLQYGHFDNKVSADAYATQSYMSKALSASVEAGYDLPVHERDGKQVVATPQAQLVYTNYRAGDVVDPAGTHIGGQNGSQVDTRLGVRVYQRQTLDNGSNRVQPFVEANWLHGNRADSVSFEGQTVASDTPANRGELKAGVEARLDRDTTAWAQGHGQWATDFSSYGALGGLKIRW